MKHTELYTQHLVRLEKELQQLADKPEENAASTLNALWHLAAGNQCSVERADNTELPALDSQASKRLAELVQRRLDGVPLGHLTQRQQFLELEFIVGPEALVPRKETELLAKTALQLLANILQHQETAMVVDACTGAGNIALTLAHHHPGATVFAADLSEDAIALADRNKSHLNLDTRVQFHTGDLLAPFANETFYGKVDLLTCNPPYISSGKLDKMPVEIAQHEPQLAFDGGPFGLSLIGRLLKEAPQYLKPKGWLAFEIGLGQGEPLQKRLSRNADYREVRALYDAEGNIRVLALQV